MKRTRLMAVVFVGACAALFLASWPWARAAEEASPEQPAIGSGVVVQIDPGPERTGFIVSAEGKLTASNERWIAVETTEPAVGTIWFAANRVTAIRVK